MIEAASIPDNTWGLEGHLEIFVAGTGYVQTGENVFLANALKPDAVNNCTVRFHDGYAIISVEDHIAGYIVMVNATSGSGSLNYALGVSTEYISVDASLNGQTLDLAGAVTNGEKHVVGNGYTETIISGGINCTSKTTLSNLAADGVIVSSGTLTLGDVYIPSGSTVAVSGGGLAVEKVVGAGSASVIDLGGTRLLISSGSTASASGCTLTSGGLAANNGGAATVLGTLLLQDCIVSGNTGYLGKGVYVQGGTLVLKDTDFATTQDITFRLSGGKVEVSGDCTIDTIRKNPQYNDSGTVILSSGAIVDLTGNTNAMPINPGGGITFEAGGATVYPSAGSASAVMIGGCTAATISNGGVVTISNGMIPNVASGASLSFTSIPIVANTVGRTVSLTNCTVTTSDAIRITSYSNVTGTLEVYGTNTFGSILSYGNNGTPILVMHDNSTISFNGVSTTYDKLVNCTIGQIVIGTNCSIVLTNGTTVPLTAGTYTSAYIAADGTITEA